MSCDAYLAPPPPATDEPWSIEATLSAEVMQPRATPERERERASASASASERERPRRRRLELGCGARRETTARRAFRPPRHAQETRGRLRDGGAAVDALIIIRVRHHTYIHHPKGLLERNFGRKDGQGFSPCHVTTEYGKGAEGQQSGPEGVLAG